MMMQDFLNKKILLGITGGIAAYKSAYLVRTLIQKGASVRVIMTASAQKFITPMTVQALSGHAVRCDVFDEQAEQAMGHIELSRWADYFLIAPATANCIAKFAQGLADDLLSTVYLAAETPVIMCPAMNRGMWHHPATQANIDALVQRGVTMVGPSEGEQACGDVGLGRMCEVDDIVGALRLLDVRGLLKGRHCLITAGPTQEPIDPVRYISNRSSGKMGYALAEAALMAGARVTLVTGPTALKPPERSCVIYTQTAKDMHHAVMNVLSDGDIFIGVAAVSDYQVRDVAVQKIKKHSQDTLQMLLDPNKDILADVSASGKACFVVGFAAETESLLEHARDKLVKKKLDMVVANQVGQEKGFESDSNEVILLTPTQQISLAYTHKTRLAGQIISNIARQLDFDGMQQRCLNECGAITKES